MSSEPSTSSAVEIKKLSVLIPAYNSERTVSALVDQLIEVLAPKFSSLEIILVNDGSTDSTHEVLRAAQARHKKTVKYIRLARNFGEHNAVMCGLRYVTGDCAAIIDDDFQNPPAEIIGLADELRKGYDVVYGYYEDKKHNWFRNLGSAFNDWMATRLLRKPRGFYLSSFKILNRFLIDTVVQYRGPFPYLDGIIFRSTTSVGRTLCRHEARKVGQSNYTFTRLVHLWLNMFTGFSIIPLRMASLAGIAMSAASFLLAAFFITLHFTGSIFIKHNIPPGWASLIVAITLFAGLQLCVLGIVGEYLGRLVLTVNRSPQFVVRETFGVDKG